MKRLRAKNTNGFLAIEWVVGISLLVVPTFILVISLLQYPPRKSLTQVAASEAAKAYVQEDNPGDALASAKLAAESVIEDELGEDTFTPTDSNVMVSPTTPEAFCPGEEIKITISIPMHLLTNPFSEADDPIIDIAEITSSATERIDDYREIENVSCL